MPRKQSDVERRPLAKGIRQRDGDHSCFHCHSQAGRKTPDFKKTSHGSKKIDDHLLGQMARLCKLTGKVFALLVDCPLDRGDDENRLADQSLNDPPDGMR